MKKITVLGLGHCVPQWITHSSIHCHWMWVSAKKLAHTPFTVQSEWQKGCALSIFFLSFFFLLQARDMCSKWHWQSHNFYLTKISLKNAAPCFFGYLSQNWACHTCLTLPPFDPMIKGLIFLRHEWFIDWFAYDLSNQIISFPNYLA